MYSQYPQQQGGQGASGTSGGYQTTAGAPQYVYPPGAPVNYGYTGVAASGGAPQLGASSARAPAATSSTAIRDTLNPDSQSTVGQLQPPGIRPRVTTTMWEDEKTLCYQVDANNVAVVRRADNNMINGTKLLNVANMTRGRRDGILKLEKVRHVVKIGSMHLKGVWIPFERALAMAQREGIIDLLYPLFVRDIKRVIQTGVTPQAAQLLNPSASSSGGSAQTPATASSTAVTRSTSGTATTTTNTTSASDDTANTSTTGSDPKQSSAYYQSYNQQYLNGNGTTAAASGAGNGASSAVGASTSPDLRNQSQQAGQYGQQLQYFYPQNQTQFYGSTQQPATASAATTSAAQGQYYYQNTAYGYNQPMYYGYSAMQQAPGQPQQSTQAGAGGQSPQTGLTGSGSAAAANVGSGASGSSEKKED